MPPSEKQRCKQCRKDKQKCELREGADRCDRCILRNCPCEDRRWPSPKPRPRPKAQDADTSITSPKTFNFDTNANNIQPREYPDYGAETWNNAYDGSVNAGSNSNSAYTPYSSYSSHSSYNGVDYNITSPTLSFEGDYQLRSASLFGTNTQQTWPDVMDPEYTDVNMNPNLYQSYDRHPTAAAYDKQSSAYRKGRRQR